MDLLQSVRKEGSRGGVDFKWEDVKNSNHRENYLGHSLMAPVGRWQKNKDLNWYAKGEDAGKTVAEREAAEAQRRKDELRKVKEAEEDAMALALGLPVPDRSANTEPLGQRAGAEESQALLAEGGGGTARAIEIAGDHIRERVSHGKDTITDTIRARDLEIVIENARPGKSSVVKAVHDHDQEMMRSLAHHDKDTITSAIRTRDQEIVIQSVHPGRASATDIMRTLDQEIAAENKNYDKATVTSIFRAQDHQIVGPEGTRADVSGNSTATDRALKVGSATGSAKQVDHLTARRVESRDDDITIDEIGG